MKVRKRNLRKYFVGHATSDIHVGDLKIVTL